MVYTIRIPRKAPMERTNSNSLKITNTKGSAIRRSFLCLCYESIKGRWMSKRLFWLVNGADKERRVVAGLDGEEERTVKG